MCTPTSASRQLKKTKGKSAHDESGDDDGVSEELMIGEADLMRTREAADILAQSGLNEAQPPGSNTKNGEAIQVAGAKHKRAAWHTSSGGNEQGGDGMHVRSARGEEERM